MKKITKIILSSLILTMIFGTVLSFSTINVSAAAIWDDGLGNLKTGATDLPGGEGADLKIAIGRIIQIFLGFLGIIAVILILFAGFMWMTAGGDTAKVDKAKAYIKNAIIGIVIILAAYIIASYALEQVSDVLK